MKPFFNRRLLPFVLLFALTFAASVLRAQDSSNSSPGQPQAAGHAEAGASTGSSGHEESGGAGPNGGVGEILEHSTEKAAHQAEIWGRKFGLNHDTSYLISVLLNFACLVFFFYFLLGSKLPQMFRDRTNSIQKAIREAQAVSAEASARLKLVEARLAKLDSEVTGIRTEAEKQAAAEEERIRATAEEDKHRVVESAKMEIDSIARNTRRDLKNYAATLAVDIAAKRIHVDESADQALVREFVNQLGKDGH